MNRNLRIAAAILALALPLTLVGCNQSDQAAKAASKKKAAAASAPVVKITPVANARSLPVTTEITAQTSNGAVYGVKLTDSNGQPVSGAFRPDDSSWVPSASLKFGQTYTAEVSAINGAGKVTTTASKFTTMAAPKTPDIHSSINVADEKTYGVGMPIVLDFGAGVPDKQKAAVERRLFVTSAPAQVGAWRWYGDRELMYRPRSYWKPGTTVQVRTALGGLPVGNRVIDKDRTATFTIGRDMHFDVTNKNHMLTITSNGKVIKRYPISMGKPSTPSWSGKFVIMSQQYYTVFNTMGQPGGGYITPVNYAERLTWSGTYFHSAPWSVYAQGRFNVSHGCVNIGPSNAKWVYQKSLIGDPVSISGTPIHVASGNGWTVWDMPWSEYVKGSALPSPMVQQKASKIPAV